MCMCNKCWTIGGVLIGLAGIAFLLQDLGKWAFWGLNWYTVLFIISALCCLGTSMCKDCKALRSCK